MTNALTNTSSAESLVKSGAVAAPGESRHLNFMGGASFSMDDPLMRLRVVSASCLFGEPQYYRAGGDDFRGRRATRSHNHGGGRRLDETEMANLRLTLNAIDPAEWRNMTAREVMETAIDEALEADMEGTLQFAVELRGEFNLRTTPQVIAVRAANRKEAKGSGLIRKYAKAVMQRADEPAVQLAYQIDAFGKPIPNGLKRAWGDVLNAQTETQLAKWRLENRKVKTADVAKLALAPRDMSDAVKSLVDGTLKLTGERQTWEAVRSRGGSWDEAVEHMGHQALRMNLRNLLQADVDPSLFLDRFVEGAATGRQMPFQYYAAWRSIVDDLPRDKAKADAVKWAIEVALRHSLGALPSLPGRSLILSDNSGSAQGGMMSSMGTVSAATVGNLMGILTAMMSEEGTLGLFGDQIEYLPVDKQGGVLEQLDGARKTAGAKLTGATENGIWLALDEAIRNRVHYDTIWVYSDMQAGHGGLYGLNGNDYADYLWNEDRGRHAYIDVAKMIAAYRKEVNPKAMVFLVQVAGYEDALVPELYDRTFILGGWSDKLLHFARKMIDLYEG